MTYLLRFIASSADMSGTCIMAHVISHTFQWDDEIKKALQVTRKADRFDISNCKLPPDVSLATYHYDALRFSVCS